MKTHFPSTVFSTGSSLLMSDQTSLTASASIGDVTHDVSTSSTSTDYDIQALLASNGQSIDFGNHMTQTDATASDALFDDVIAHMETQTNDDLLGDFDLNDSHTQTIDCSLMSGSDLDSTLGSSSVETQTMVGATEHSSVQIQVRHN